MAIFGKLMQPAQAALPALFAATAAEAINGEYYGPVGENEYTGYPGSALITENVRNPHTTKRFWQLTESVTGSKFL